MKKILILTVLIGFLGFLCSAPAVAKDHCYKVEMSPPLVNAQSDYISEENPILIGDAVVVGYDHDYAVAQAKPVPALSRGPPRL